MSKVVLTKEQAEAIESLKELWKEKTAEERNNILIKEKVNGGYDSNGFYKSLNVLSVSNFAESLFGYEIEQPKFEIGDWVTNTACNKTFKVHAVTNKSIVRIEDAEHWDCGNHYQVRWYSPEETRHATKEEIFWAELGREVGEFKVDDVVRSTYSIRPYNLKSKQDLLDAKSNYRENYIKGFYPAESFKSFPTGNE